MAQLKWFATKQLKQYRSDNKRLQEDMVNLIKLHSGKEISISLYRQWENGERPIDPDSVLTLSGITGLNYKELVTQK